MYGTLRRDVARQIIVTDCGVCKGTPWTREAMLEPRGCTRNVGMAGMVR
jgi:hypothetical protein